MVISEGLPRNAFVHRARKVYKPLGFSRGYNFTLWFIFGGALFGFSLARLKYLDFDGQFCPDELSGSNAAPSQCYMVQFPRYRVGMLLHLASVLPAGLLAVFQFVPAIRHRFILYHRMAGYIIALLIVVGNASAIMIADRSMEGDLPTRTFVGVMAVVTTCTIGMALYNIKRLQIDQHRAWMLRTWFYLGFIITLRIIQILVAMIISAWPEAVRYDVMACDELSFILRNDTALYSQYPACKPGSTSFSTDGYVAVKAKLGGGDDKSMAAVGVSFAAGGYLALVLHAVGVEIYLKMTAREAERLRQVSYERQLAKGYKNPGSAGLVLERFGDMDPWQPKHNKAEATIATERVSGSETDGALSK